MLALVGRRLAGAGVYLLACLASGGSVSCGAVGGGSGSAAAHAVSEHPLIGSAAPPLDLPGASRTPHAQRRLTLQEYAGRVVILDFWATWCEPCRKSFPAYQRLANEFEGQLAVLAVSVDEDPDGIAGFVKATGARFPIAWDEGQVAAQSYTPPKMPTSFVIDRSGIVRFVHAGYSEGDEQQLRDEVLSLLTK